MNNLDVFYLTYVRELELAVKNYPQEYVYGVDQVNDVAKRMYEAFKRKSYNKDGRAIKATCKSLGIKHTYKAIEEFWNGVGGFTQKELAQ